MKKIILFGIIFSIIVSIQFSQINYKYTGDREFYFDGKVLKRGDIVSVDEFMYKDNFEMVVQGSEFPELYMLREQVSITAYPQVSGEVPGGDVNGDNQDFSLSKTPVIPLSLTVTLTEFTQVEDETPVGDMTGDINSSNTDYTLGNTPVIPGSLSITVDSEATQITDDGNGTLSDGGTITYSSGQVELQVQPDTSISQDYEYSQDTEITDSSTNVLSDGGSVDYDTGIFTLNSQPQTGSLLQQDYSYTKQTVTQFEVNRLQDVKVKVDIDDSNEQDLTLYYNDSSSIGVPLTQDYEQVVDSKYFNRLFIHNSNADAVYTVTFKDNSKIVEE